MKRFLASALIFGVFSITTFVGCSDTSTTGTDVKVKGPDGSTTEVKDKKEVKETGSNPPPVGDVKAPEPTTKP